LISIGTPFGSRKNALLEPDVAAEREIVIETLQRHRAPRFGEAVYRIPAMLDGNNLSFNLTIDGSPTAR
jgi:hypothetical protein